jgi:hypothetical protein
MASHNYQYDNCYDADRPSLSVKVSLLAGIQTGQQPELSREFPGSRRSGRAPRAREANRDQDYVAEIAGFRVRKAGDSRRGRRIVNDFLTSSRLKGADQLKMSSRYVLVKTYPLGGVLSLKFLQPTGVACNTRASSADLSRRREDQRYPQPAKAAVLGHPSRNFAPCPGS